MRGEWTEEGREVAAEDQGSRRKLITKLHTSGTTKTIHVAVIPQISGSIFL